MDWLGTVGGVTEALYYTFALSIGGFIGFNQILEIIH